MEFIVKSFPTVDRKLQKIKTDTEKDDLVGSLKEMTVKVWPESKNNYNRFNRLLVWDSLNKASGW